VPWAKRSSRAFDSAAQRTGSGRSPASPLRPQRGRPLVRFDQRRSPGAV